MKTTLSVAIGIPTYAGGPSLVEAVKSIRVSKGAESCRLIVTVDGRPLEKDVISSLQKMNVEIIFNKVRGGQVTRTKQLIALAKTDILILTQDDIRFTKDTVGKLTEEFEKDDQVTMLAARVLPEPATTLLERVIEVGVRLTHRIGDLWNSGDNYLLSSGRCLAFRTRFVKKFVIPDAMINSDAFFYFENKRLGGTFRQVKNAIVFNKSPQKLAEHLKQSKKFQLSHEELSHYLSLAYDQEYRVSPSVILRAYGTEFLSDPISTVLYVLLFVYTRFAGRNLFTPAQRFWEVDTSTKRVNLGEAK